MEGEHRNLPEPECLQPSYAVMLLWLNIPCHIMQHWDIWEEFSVAGMVFPTPCHGQATQTIQTLSHTQNRN